MNSKILILFVTVFGLALANVPAPRPGSRAASFGINDQIIKLIEDFKQKMPCGVPELGIPILAPLKQDYFGYQHSQTLIDIILSLFDLQIDGLDNFEVNSVSLSVLLLKFKFDFTFKEIHLNSQYVANAALLKYIKINGKGDADITIKDMRIVGEAQIGSDPTTKDLQLKNFKITVVLGHFKTDITGLLWGKLTGKLANSMIERVVPYLLKHRHDEITGMVEEAVIEMANDKLKGITIKDLLDFINKPREPSQCTPPTRMVMRESREVESSQEAEEAFEEFKQIVQYL